VFTIVILYNVILYILCFIIVIIEYKIIFCYIILYSILKVIFSQSVIS